MNRLWQNHLLFWSDEQNSKPDSNVQKKETHIEMQTSNNVESEAQYVSYSLVCNDIIIKN